MAQRKSFVTQATWTKKRTRRKIKFQKISENPRNNKKLTSARLGYREEEEGRESNLFKILVIDLSETVAKTDKTVETIQN